MNGSHRGRMALASLVLATGLAVPAPLASQEDRLSSLRVIVRSAADRAALRNAQVVVLGTGIGELTREDGTVLLSRLAPGPLRVQVRAVGHAVEQVTVNVDEGRTAELRIELRVQPVVLAGIRVRPEGMRGTKMLTDNGFYGRRAARIGTFLTRDEIAAQRPRLASDVLRRIPGMRLTPMRGGEAYASSGRTQRARACPIQYFIDGVAVHDFNIDEVRPSDIQGIEVYRGSSQVPAQFNRHTAMCGVIVVWTRID
jgi:hypothetical protein